MKFLSYQILEMTQAFKNILSSKFIVYKDNTIK
jgi:hypothetical protein